MEKGIDKKCHHINEKGERCNAFSQEGSLFCFFHDPERAEEQALARSESGKSRSLTFNLGPIQVEKPRDITEIITRTLNEIRKGSCSPQIANSFFYGCGVLLKSYEVTESAHLEEGKACPTCKRVYLKHSTVDSNQTTEEMKKELERYGWKYVGIPTGQEEGK